MMKALKNLFRKAKSALRGLKSKFDREGSYTGTPSDGETAPQQDADDL